jgi:hypothetical protein
MGTMRPTSQPRGICPAPACRRNVALLADGIVARPHKDCAGDPCPGRGLKAWPLPEVP